MQCPMCSVSLRREKYEYVVFDLCPQCRGIWVEGEHFRSLAVRVAAEGDVRSSAKVLFKPRAILTPEADNRIKICPHCHTSMRMFNYAYDSNIFLDRCDTCMGFWLDPDEIFKVAAHLQYNPEANALGRSILDMQGMVERETARAEGWLNLIMIFLRVLIFRY